jgi:hypothetical protein
VPAELAETFNKLQLQYCLLELGDYIATVSGLAGYSLTFEKLFEISVLKLNNHQRTLKVTIRYFFPKIGKFIGFTKFWEVFLIASLQHRFLSKSTFLDPLLPDFLYLSCLARLGFPLRKTMLNPRKGFGTAISIRSLTKF